MRANAMATGESEKRNQYIVRMGMYATYGRYLDWRDALLSLTIFAVFFVATTSFLGNFRNHWTILGESANRHQSSLQSRPDARLAHLARL